MYNLSYFESEKKNAGKVCYRYLSGVSPLLGVVGLHAGPRPHAQLAPGAGRVDAGQPGVVADVQGPDKYNVIRYIRLSIQPYQLCYYSYVTSTYFPTHLISVSVLSQ